MEESPLPSFLWLRGNDSLLAVLGGRCDPCSPSHGLVASSWSDKQHFHLVVAPVQPSLGHGEKKRMSGFKPMHMALESGRPFGRAHTMFTLLQLLALDSLQGWKRGELNHELTFWGHSKFLFWQTAPTSWSRADHTCTGSADRAGSLPFPDVAPSSSSQPLASAGL